MNNSFVRLALLILAIPVLASLLRAAPMRSSPVVTWVFVTREDPQLVPHTKVYLSSGTRRILIQSNAQCQFHTVAPSAYPGLDVPASALAACQGWFAGGGENLYVIRHGPSLKIYRQDLEEQSPTEPYRLIRSTSLMQGNMAR